MTQHPPRGLIEHNPGAPTATARWGVHSELTEYSYTSGDIFLGSVAVPADEVKATLTDLDDFKSMLAQDSDLDDAWKDHQIGLANHHKEILRRTAQHAIGIRDDRHMVTLAGSRGGKGTSAIVPNLCLYPGSAVVIDPKGENARLTATRRGGGSDHCEGMGQRTIVLDPYNASRTDAALRGSWNPLDLLALDDPEVTDKAASIAEAVIIRSKGEDAHFDDSARTFIKGLILFVAIVHNGTDKRNLLTVYDLLMRGAYYDLDEGRENPDASDAFTLLLCQMTTVTDLNGIVAGAATALLDMGERERGSVLSTARRNLEFLERDAMRSVLKSSSFDLNAIKTDPGGMTLYLCLPPQRMADCGRWLRLMINVTLERIYEIEPEPATGHPILFLLEEFASLKHMESLENAAGYAAGFGVKLWVIIQDLSQLKRHYKEGWETFLGNAGIIQAFANSDATSLEYLSKRLGEVEVTQSVKNVTTSLTATTNDPGDSQRVQSLIQNRGAASMIANPFTLMFQQGSTGQSATSTSASSEQIQRAPLLLPDEIERFFRREVMNQLISIKGMRPFILDRENYYEASRFMGLYEPDRGLKLTHAEAGAKRNTVEEKLRTEAQHMATNAKRFVNETKSAVRQAKGSKR